MIDMFSDVHIYVWLLHRMALTCKVSLLVLVYFNC